MKLTDSHVHFDLISGPTGIEATIERAVAAGVTRLIAVGGSPRLNSNAIRAARRWPRAVKAAIGWDRDQTARFAGSLVQPDEDTLTTTLENRLRRCRQIGAAIAAIGEIGLDYHYSANTAEAQRRLMRLQLAAARRLELPVIVHSRDADLDTLDLLTEHHAACRFVGIRGVVHCFTGGRDFARKLIDLGFMLGFSGIVSFKTAVTLREVSRLVPDDRLLVETDSPYLAPVPCRGRRNEPALLPHVLRHLAMARGIAENTLAEITNRNAATLFGFPTDSMDICIG